MQSNTDLSTIMSVEEESKKKEEEEHKQKIALFVFSPGITLNLFTYFGANDLATMSELNKRIYHQANADQIWQKKLAQDFPHHLQKSQNKYQKLQEFELVPFPTLLNEKMEKAKVGKIYISQDGHYVFRHPLREIVLEGDLGSSPIDLEQLDDPELQKRVLARLSEAGHSNYNGYWKYQFKKAAALDYQRFSKERKKLFTWVKEGNVERLKNTLTLADLDEEDQSGTSLLDWGLIMGNQAILDLFYELVSKQYQGFFKPAVTKKDIRGRTLLHWAFLCRQRAAITSLLNRNADVNTAYAVDDDIMMTPLCIAASYGYLDLVNDLLKKPSGPDIQLALILAAHEGHYAVVEALLPPIMTARNDLLEKKADFTAEINAINSNNSIALIAAAESGHHELVTLLLNHGVNVDMVRKDSETALTLAIKGYHFEVAELLVEKVSSSIINTANDKGYTALMLAAQCGHLGLVKALLAKGAEINTVAKNGKTALVLAAEHGHLDLLQFLLEKGANLNPSNNKELSAYLTAAEQGHLKVVQYLLAKGVDVNTVTKSGYTALMLAFMKGHLDVIEYLIKQKIDVNIATKNGYTTLIFAAEHDHLELIQYLLANGANVNAATKSGYTALIMAAEYGHLEVVQCLLDNHANVNAAKVTGITALMMATKHGHFKIIRTLLEKKFAILTETDMREAFFLAVKQGNGDIVKLFMEYNPSIHTVQRVKDNMTPLMLAAKNCYLQMMNDLLKAEPKLDINMCSTFKGHTALYLAVENEDSHAVEALLKHGADINIKNQDGMTALSQAVINDDLVTVKVILAHSQNISLDTLDAALAIAKNPAISNVFTQRKTEEAFLQYKKELDARPDDSYTEHTMLGVTFDFSFFGAIKAKIKKEAAEALRQVYFEGKNSDLLKPYTKALETGQLGEFYSRLKK